MASTTTNLGLTKPAYSDDADISDINGNMDLIDAEAGRVRANVAANYDSSETYAVGDYCLHDGSLYKCSTAISSPEAWTAGHWTQIKITGELSALNGKIANIFKTKTDTGTIDTNGYFTTTTKSSDCLIVGVKAFTFGGYARNAYKYETLRYGGDGNLYNGLKFKYWDDSVLGVDQQAIVTYVYIDMP